MNSVRVDQLVGSTPSFEEALRSLGGVRGQFIASFLDSLDSSTLENAERERRLSAVFARAELGLIDYVAIVEAGLRLKNIVLRNALAQLLPAEFKSKIFRGMRQQSATASDAPPVARAVTLPESTPERAPIPGSSSAAAPAREEVILEPSDPHSDVLILSSSEDPATRKLLSSRGFVPLRCTSTDELDAMLGTNVNVCAALVTSSFLGGLDLEQQRSLTRQLAQFSTFVWLRFEEDKLRLPNLEVMDLIRSERCRTSATSLAGSQ